MKIYTFLCEDSIDSDKFIVRLREFNWQSYGQKSWPVVKSQSKIDRKIVIISLPVLRFSPEMKVSELEVITSTRFTETIAFNYHLKSIN